MIDFDDEIVEMVLARQPVAALIADQADGLIVMAVLRVFAPGVFGPDRPDRQIRCCGLRMAVGAPPQLPAAGDDAPGSRRSSPSRLLARMPPRLSADRDGPAVRRQPAPARGCRPRLLGPGWPKAADHARLSYK